LALHEVATAISRDKQDPRHQEAQPRVCCCCPPFIWLLLLLLLLQEVAAATAREEEDRRRHEAHLKKLQEELEAKKEEERRCAGILHNAFLVSSWVHPEWVPPDGVCAHVALLTASSCIHQLNVD
jgi:hypothetical protein